METRRCISCMNPIDTPVCPHCGYPASTSNDEHQLPVGFMLRGRYQIGKVLGQGGFGITYLAWDTLMDQSVAVKEFYPNGSVYRNCAATTQVECVSRSVIPHFEYSKERFLREARALVKFKDIPEVVDLLDFVSENNTAYIVMEYVKGVDLAKYVYRKGGRLTVDETFRILRPVMEALAKVHKGGIVHRDISPDNIILDPMGGAKLLDFGAVRSVENPDVEKGLNKSTEAILKHGFAPMEQYNTRGSLGPWTDEYAMCATVWYCLTGDVPPEASLRITEGIDPIWGSVPGLPVHQQRALERGFAKVPKDRFPDMDSLIAALFPAQAPVQQVPVQQPQMQQPDFSKTVNIPPAQQIQPPRSPVATGEMAQPANAFTAPSGNGRKLLPILLGAGALVVAAILAAILLLPKAKSEPVPEVYDPEETVPVSTVQIRRDDLAWEENVLAPGFLWMLDISSDQVTQVQFLDTLADAPANAVDVSASDSAGLVLAWSEGGTVTVAANNGINGRDACGGMFLNCTALESVCFGGALHTEQATSFRGMFKSCTALTSVDAQNLATDSAEDLSEMFNECEALTELDVSGFRTGNVVTLKHAFFGCSAVKKLDVSNWDTGRVTNMNAVFMHCFVLEELDVSRWDTGSVTNMSFMFCGCKALQQLDVSAWNTSRVTTLQQMFSRCVNLSTLDLTEWDTSSVTTLTRVFESCSLLIPKGVEGWNTANVTDMEGVFYFCKALTQIDLSRWEVGKVTTMGYMFCGCANLTQVNTTGWDTSSVQLLNSMFDSCDSLRHLDLSHWNVSSVEKVRGMFHSYTAGRTAPSLVLNGWDLSHLRPSNYEDFMREGEMINGRPWEEFFAG